ncbi:MULTISPECIES: serpin family protein [unclassified Nonomuraea]|uniref:serpin family protein n=1 Tax=unclassified Nonomuraea TaxID=2593643 RepID=UPI0035BFC5F3
MRNPVNALTARWAAACSGESVVMSGAGVWPLLAYLASAADGPGRAELQEAIGIDAGRAAQAAAGVLRSLTGPAVSSAVGLWFARSLRLNPSWLSALPDGLRGELSGDPAVDQLRLDAWAAERTGGLVPAMPVEVTEDTELVLAGALTVRTAWLRPFQAGVGTFWSGPWAGTEVAMLYRSTSVVDRLRVVATPSGPLTMLRVMGTGGIDMHLVLGERDAPGEVLAGGIGVLDGGRPVVMPPEEGPGVTVVREPASEPGDRLKVTVPRFTISARHDLLSLPEVFGLATVTDTNRGHFPGISPEPLAIEDAAQVTVADFSATGFESATITAFGAVGGGIPRLPYRARHVHVVFDRPFGFLAAERRTGLILTAGWVADPQPAEPVAG